MILASFSKIRFVMKVCIYSTSIQLSDEMLEVIRCKALFSFSRFQNDIDKIDLTIKKVEEPKGTNHQLCSISLKGPIEDLITVSAKAQGITACVDKSITRAQSAVARKIKLRKIHRQHSHYFKK